MLLKKPVGRSRIYDLIHKFGVNVCIAVTGVGLIGLGYIGYDFFTRYRESVNKPKLKEAELLESGGMTEKM